MILESVDNIMYMCISVCFLIVTSWLYMCVCLMPNKGNVVLCYVICICICSLIRPSVGSSKAVSNARGALISGKQVFGKTSDLY